MELLDRIWQARCKRVHLTQEERNAGKKSEVIRGTKTVGRVISKNKWAWINSWKTLAKISCKTWAAGLILCRKSVQVYICRLPKIKNGY